MNQNSTLIVHESRNVFTSISVITRTKNYHRPSNVIKFDFENISSAENHEKSNKHKGVQAKQFHFASEKPLSVGLSKKTKTNNNSITISRALSDFVLRAQFHGFCAGKFGSD